MVELPKGGGGLILGRGGVNKRASGRKGGYPHPTPLGARCAWARASRPGCREGMRVARSPWLACAAGMRCAPGG